MVQEMKQLLELSKNLTTVTNGQNDWILNEHIYNTLAMAIISISNVDLFPLSKNANIKKLQQKQE